METSLPTPPPTGGATPAVFSNVRTWNVLCHASALLGVFFHFPGHLLGPLIVWLAKRDDSPEIDVAIFNMEEFEGADWVQISDEVPLDEDRRDELLQNFQVHYHLGAISDDDDEPPDTLEEDHQEVGRE